MTHGGFGVPLIVFPCWADQFGNAARVVYHQLSIRGNPKKINVKKLNEMIDEVMNNEKYRTLVNEMNFVFTKQENCQRGLEFVESYLAELSRTN